MDLGLNGRTAIVTGASRGIGLAVVRGLVAEGVRVTAGARRSSAELDEVAGTGMVRVVEVDLADPGGQMSVIYDNRNRISTRLKQLRTGRRYAQTPPSRLRRVVSNVEVLGREGGDTVVGANFILAEARERGVVTWAGCTTYRLRWADGELKLAAKQVLLVNRDQPLPTLGFLI